jgi:hypothetical protein
MFQLYLTSGRSIDPRGDRWFLQRAYEEAVRQRYRFYSYGDAMLVL